MRGQMAVTESYHPLLVDEIDAVYGGPHQLLLIRATLRL